MGERGLETDERGRVQNSGAGNRTVVYTLLPRRLRRVHWGFRRGLVQLSPLVTCGVHVPQVKYFSYTIHDDSVYI